MSHPAPVGSGRLTSSDTVTRCPYKGLASNWWSTADIEDVAWSYPEPTRALQPIAGLVCFDDTKVRVTVQTQPAS